MREEEQAGYTPRRSDIAAFGEHILERVGQGGKSRRRNL